MNILAFRFKAMAPMYYRNANAALLVFDVTSQESFEEVKFWVMELRKNVQEKMFLLLVGNKIDLDEMREVSSEEAESYALTINATYLETSVPKNQVSKWVLREFRNFQIDTFQVKNFTWNLIFLN